jgi:hypothetical protein
MKIILDQLEARLQALIESSVTIFARGDSQQRLAHQLVASAQENIVMAADGRAIAPNLFTIFLHPDSLAYWQAHSSVLEAISASMQEAAREFNVHFATTPVLRLAPDPRLPLEGMRVIASDQREMSGQTAAFAPVQTTALQSAMPRNAFLIIDGERVFPLDQPVINIGRRPDNHLVMADPRVSRGHAQIRAIRGQYVLFDLNSTGGTAVNGRRIQQCALKPGDVISLSGVPLIYGEDSLHDEDTYDTGYTHSMREDLEPPEGFE